MAAQKYLNAPVLWLGVATSLRLTTIADRCRAVVLEDLMKGAFYGNSIINRIFPKEHWDKLPASEYQSLMNSLLRAFSGAVNYTF